MSDQRDTQRPMIGDIRKDLEEVRELLGRVMSHLTLIELSELAGEAHLITHDAEISELKNRVTELEALRPTAAE